MPNHLGTPRVLFLEALPTISGGQRALIDLMPALAKKFDTSVVVPSEGPLAEALRASSVSLTFVPMASYTLVEKHWRDILRFVTDTPRLALVLARLVRRQSARLIYINNSRAFIWGTLGAWVTRCPVIWHAHGILGDRKTRAIVSLFARLNNVRKIICPSEVAAAEFAQQKHKVAVVPSGIDLECFAPSVAARANKRGEFGIAPNTPTIGIVGDLIPLKGQEVFIRAAAKVASHISNAVFLIVGDARPTEASRRYKSDLQAAARSSRSAIRFVGFRPDIAAVLNALDILVIASSTETGPLVLLQALACGVPVLSTPVGMARPALGDGTCGEIFPIDDESALAAKLVHLMDQPERRAEMSRAARQRAVAQFDLKFFQTRIAGIIQQAIQ